MSSTQTAINHRGWEPTLDNRPMGYWERLNNRLLMGLPLTILALTSMTLLILGDQHLIHLSPTWFFTFDILTVLSMFAYVQLPLVLLLSLLHKFERSVEIREWAGHGYYREGFEPKGYDLTQLKKISHLNILEALQRS